MKCYLSFFFLYWSDHLISCSNIDYVFRLFIFPGFEHMSWINKWTVPGCRYPLICAVVLHHVWKQAGDKFPQPWLWFLFIYLLFIFCTYANQTWVMLTADEKTNWDESFLPKRDDDTNGIGLKVPLSVFPHRAVSVLRLIRGLAWFIRFPRLSSDKMQQRIKPWSPCHFPSFFISLIVIVQACFLITSSLTEETWDNEGND